MGASMALSETWSDAKPPENLFFCLSFPPSLKVITIFTLVEVVLMSDGAPLKYSALLKRPSLEK